jgi:hypothetical protein
MDNLVMVKTAETLPLFAVYELPAPLALEANGLGATIPMVLGSLAGSLVLPELAWPGDQPQIVGPELSGKASALLRQGIERHGVWHFWGQVSSWNAVMKTVAWAWLGAVLFKLEVPKAQISYSDYRYGLGHPIGPQIDQLHLDIDVWFEGLRTWIEVICDQDADPTAPLQSLTVTGKGLRTWTEEEDISLLSSPNHITTVMRIPEPISLSALEGVLGLLATGSRPSDAHLMLRDARAAHRRHRSRQALIDTGSAIEMALADFNRKVTKVPIPTYPKPSLGWYVNEPKIARGAALPPNTKVVLVKKRNDAMHNNITPSWSETELALSLAQQIVRKLEPIPI